MKSNKALISFLILLFLGYLSNGSAFSQGKSITIDKIIAKADNYIILKSDLEKAYQSFLSNGNESYPGLKCDILKQILIEKVLVAKAEIDSIIVPETSIEVELERRMAYFIMEAGSEEILESHLGRSVAQLKDELRHDVREQLTTNEMRSTVVKDVTITPNEVKKFFQRIPKDSIPVIPSEYKVAQIIMYPKVNAAEKKKVRDQLLSIKAQVLQGADFADFAKKHSEDYQSAAKGGDLGYRGRGEFVPEFEAAVFGLKEGEISDPVESDYGYHLIQLLERKGDRFLSRHILIRPRSNADDYDAAIVMLDSIRTLIEKDSLSFAKAAKEYSDDRQSKMSGGLMSSSQGGHYIEAVELGQSDYELFQIIDKMTPGELSKPMKFRTKDEKDAVRLLHYVEKRDAHYASLATDYEKIYQATLTQKKEEELNRWFNIAIKELYIHIDPEYNFCNIMEGL